MHELFSNIFKKFLILTLLSIVKTHKFDEFLFKILLKNWNLFFLIDASLLLEIKLALLETAVVPAVLSVLPALWLETMPFPVLLTFAADWVECSLIELVCLGDLVRLVKVDVLDFDLLVCFCELSSLICNGLDIWCASLSRRTSLMTLWNNDWTSSYSSQEVDSKCIRLKPIESLMVDVEISGFDFVLFTYFSITLSTSCLLTCLIAKQTE